MLSAGQAELRFEEVGLPADQGAWANSYTPGALVRARGRDWVVLPSDDPDLLTLRPLTGGDDVAGIFLPIEHNAVAPTEFKPPDPARAGDAAGGMLLRDAARLRLRDGAAPFRSLGRLSVVPRPYQFVPLIMALRLDPVRLLIADDVGVGKTIEAAMIARELLDRGVARRLAVICPAHLCDQWEAELREKFVLDATVIQPSRIGRLERNLPRADLSIYQYYPHLVVSIDFVKSDRNRDRFLQNAPDLIIVDEAHMAARPRGDADRVQHQRHEFLQQLAAGRDRHLILVTATPHSGVEESFRSLLGLLNPAFDVQATGAELDRRQLLPHMVQRRRSDLVNWLGTATPFPERISEERTYRLSEPYRSLFEDVLSYCRGSLRAAGSLRAQQQRVRHWAAIALLRCVLSSPNAAIAVLTERARRQGLVSEAAPTAEAVDDAYRPQVLDPLEEETIGDYVPSAPVEDADAQLTDGEKRRLSRFLQQARDLVGPLKDSKLVEAATALGEMLRAGFRPIVFCRFIATAKYLESQIRDLLVGEFFDLRVTAVTGEIGDEERREKVLELASEPRRILIATDCLSEGINLQDHFDAVVHYDLPWNPNRLEQREGRVDRFGQRRREVKAAILYGADNPVDLTVLDVLIRKARTIRNDLGISVPVPVESEQVIQAVVNTVLLRESTAGIQLRMALTDPEVSTFHAHWDMAAQQEKEHRAFFSQHAIKPDEVRKEIEATEPILGDPDAVQRFLGNAAQRFGGELRPSRREGVFDLDPGDLREFLAARQIGRSALSVTFDRLKDERALYLGRTHPLVAAFCDAVLGAALSPEADPRFARCGAVFTSEVQIRTAVVLLRMRYMLREMGLPLPPAPSPSRGGRGETSGTPARFAEEVVLAAFVRRAGEIHWIEPFDRAAHLLQSARPAANMSATERSDHITWALDLLRDHEGWFAPVVAWRVRQLQEAHGRLRKLVKTPRLVVQPHTPPDILGCYVLVPTGGGR
ncbi:MAG: DEAD/DEAH box helicase [Chloroflexi bacterium]|nr:DEAD/DEAH box helicase [Chloroflexota bacterium]